MNVVLGNGRISRRRRASKSLAKQFQDQLPEMDALMLEIFCGISWIPCIVVRTVRARAASRLQIAINVGDAVRNRVGLVDRCTSITTFDEIQNSNSMSRCQAWRRCEALEMLRYGEVCGRVGEGTFGQACIEAAAPIIHEFLDGALVSDECADVVLGDTVPAGSGGVQRSHSFVQSFKFVLRGVMKI